MKISWWANFVGQLWRIDISCVQAYMLKRYRQGYWTCWEKKIFKLWCLVIVVARWKKGPKKDYLGSPWVNQLNVLTEKIETLHLESVIKSKKWLRFWRFWHHEFKNEWRGITFSSEVKKPALDSLYVSFHFDILKTILKKVSDNFLDTLTTVWTVLEIGRNARAMTTFDG